MSIDSDEAIRIVNGWHFKGLRAAIAAAASEATSAHVINGPFANPTVTKSER